uniref:DUF4346 domain-containing protein n=1 Tax=Sarcopeltis skottsbergii TaxID=2765380 RepID=A0A7M1VKS1_SARSK|nr:hypothetical protein [Sarcopeltis skottsbergii]
MDNCYCLIRLILSKDIVLYFFQDPKHNINHPICFTACSANVLSKLIYVYKNTRYLSVQHYLYLGQEIYKAEQCLFLGQEYIQN